MAAPVEAKVQASTAAAAVSGLALWALGHYVFKGDVPDVVASWVYVIVPAAVTFMAGYAARHTPRGGPAGLPRIPYAPPPRPHKTLLPRGGYSAGDTVVSDLPPPPPSVTAPAAETPPAAPPE